MERTDDTSRIQALSWTMFAPFWGGLGIGYFVQGNRAAGRLRLLLTLSGAFLFVAILATMNPFVSNVDGTGLLLTLLLLYVVVWLGDVVALIVRLIQESRARRRSIVVASTTLFLICLAWMMAWVHVFVRDGLPITNAALLWGTVVLSGFAVALFLYAVCAIPSAQRNRRLRLRLMALVLGGTIGLLGAAAAVDRRLEAAMAWSFGGALWVASMVLLLLVESKAPGTTGWLFTLAATLYVSTWGGLLAGVVVAANLDTVRRQGDGHVETERPLAVA